MIPLFKFAEVMLLIIVLIIYWIRTHTDDRYSFIFHPQNEGHDDFLPIKTSPLGNLLSALVWVSPTYWLAYFIHYFFLFVKRPYLLCKMKMHLIKSNDVENRNLSLWPFQMASAGFLIYLFDSSKY